MHGRLKVKSTAQQEAERKAAKEKEKKQYQAVMGMIFDRRDAGDLGDKTLQLTASILEKNPDVNTMWNIRKECIIKRENEENQDERLKLELAVTLSCLGKNPKSYGAWHHRAWCLSRMSDPDWSKEISLCDQCLKQDERNFHCWDHRVFVIRSRGGGLEEELEFSDAKILANQSNYSAWHYRSTLLPKVHSAKEEDEDGRGIGITRKQWEAELDLVLSSLYTDDSDSSAWFYLRWLLGDYSKRRWILENPCDVILLQHRFNKVSLLFRRPVVSSDFQVRVNGQAICPGSLTTPYREGSASRIWQLRLDCQAIKILEVFSKDMETRLFHTGQLNEQDTDFHAQLDNTDDTEPDEKLKELLEEIENLSKTPMGPVKSKWPLLFKAMLQQELRRPDHQALKSIDETKAEDKLRTGLYDDWKGKVTWDPELPFYDKNFSASRERSFDFLPFLLSCKKLRLPVHLGPAELLKFILEHPGSIPESIQTIEFSINEDDDKEQMESVVDQIRDLYLRVKFKVVPATSPFIRD